MPETKHNDKEFLKDIKQWPNCSDFGRYCCLKNKNYDIHAFILTADNPTGLDNGIILSLGNIFDGGTGETVYYESIKELLEDGWKVD